MLAETGSEISRKSVDPLGAGLRPRRFDDREAVSTDASDTLPLQTGRSDR